MATPATWSELARWREALRGERYDVVIDAQGLIKSAVIASVALGRKHGLDAASAREALAARFYDVRHHVARAQHAVERNRQLFGSALGYHVRGEADYGLQARDAPTARDSSDSPEVYFLHSTTSADKHWPESRWIELGRALCARGLRVVLPWGDSAGAQRSERIAAALSLCRVPRALGIDELAWSLRGAHAVVGVDTGLSHLAAALGAPVIGLYCATSPALTGIHGAPRARNLGGRGTPPSAQAVLEALAELGVC